MIIGNTYFRVSYFNTDQIGFIYHLKYFRYYYEKALREIYRSIGIPYHDIEDEDLIFLVMNDSVRFIKPAY